MKTTVCIIGGGLSGLVVAHRLAQHGIDFTLFEANSRLGGRILSKSTNESSAYGAHNPAIDLGPSWFWAGQNQLAKLINELGLKEFVYLQASAGDSVMEYGNGDIVSGQGSASMAGSYRLRGGMFHLVQRLADSLPPHSFITQAHVSQLTCETNGMIVDVTLPHKTQQINCDEVVLALPPRVLARTISFKPSLPEQYSALLTAVPTWMAGQAKFVAVYETSFWTAMGLSGDGLSQIGPLVEIHDASPESGGPYALFGFVGIPAAQRENHSERVKSAALDQLARMFGEQARHPLSVHMKDWAFDPLTAIDLDQGSHGRHVTDVNDWVSIPGHKIIWAGTESSQSFNHSNGYLEGAVDAGERAASLLLERA